MAVITVTPADDITTVINTIANPGDVILVGDGIYNQSVLVTKDNIRIIANGTGAVFDGANTLMEGFQLQETTGVEINGFIIINYVQSGIYVNGGRFNRILGNRVISSGFIGIELSGTTGNLVWRNEVSRNDGDGILTIDASTGNWIIENIANNNETDGLETFLTQDTGNVLASNRSTGNQDGFEIFGTNLMLGNTAVENAADGAFTQAFGLVCVGNRLNSNNGDGIQVSQGNSILLDNEISNNQSAGIRVFANFHILEGNEFEGNDIGILIDATGGSNLIIRNEALGNRIFDIQDDGTDNNFVQNECCSSSPPGLCGD